ncbi:MAG: DNA recombination protein RmuC [Gemmatimonadota bacterium]|nr:MAG: DNA recombination protein RmuC [Gemmatimonadota bacterium]
MDLGTVLLAILVMVALWLAWRQARVERAVRRMAEAPPASLQLLQREVQAMRSGVDERLREHLQQANELSRRIGLLQKATENVEQLGIGLGELQKILQPPQLRGAFGERMLEDLLADVLPRDRFRLQHTYPSSGARVDAVIFLGDDRLLPIDSKFPLDNFRRYVDLRGSGAADADAAWRAFARDVRGHIDDVAAKYIVPDEGALDVAFMYIPSESVFHEVAIGPLDDDGRSLSEYAVRKRVIPVSPNTLNAYLSVVRMGLRGFQLQACAREILQHLTHLGSDVEQLRSELDRALKQARHSLANLSDADAALHRVEQRLETFSSSGQDEPLGVSG